MNSKHRDILQANRSFLSRNIIWTDSMASQFAFHSILTDYMLKDIQTTTSRTDKVVKLLDVLPLRGPHAFSKFCDILHYTGQIFIADFLLEEESGMEKVVINDLFKRLTFLERNLRESERKQIESYVVEKIKEELLRQSWKKDQKEKEKALDAKQKQLEQAFEFESVTRDRDEKLKNLQDEINSKEEKCVLIKGENRLIKQSMIELEEKFKEDLAIQVKFNLANDSSLQRVTDKCKNAEKVLHELSSRIGKVLKTHNRQKERDDLTQTPFKYLIEDMDIMMEMVTHLMDTEKQYELLLEERDWILVHLGFTPDESSSLLNAYKHFAVQNEDNITNLRSEIVKYDGLLQEQGNHLETMSKEKNEHKRFGQSAGVWQGAIMSVMRKQLRDLRSENSLKSTQIEFLEEETSKQRKILADKEAILIPNGLEPSDNDNKKLEEKLRHKKKKLPPLKKNDTPSPIPAPVIQRRPEKRAPLRAPQHATASHNSQTLGDFYGALTSVKLGHRDSVDHNMGLGLGDLKSIHGKGKPPKTIEMRQTVQARR